MPMTRLLNKFTHPWAMRYIHDIKFGMLEVRENEISLRKWSGGTAHAQLKEGAQP